MNRNERLEHRIDVATLEILEQHRETLHECIVGTIVRVAARYWDGFDPDDFCVQHVGFESIIFGSTNRLRWTPARGFQPDRVACNANFLRNWGRLGPLPGGELGP